MPTELSYFILLIAQEKLDVYGYVEESVMKFKKIYLVHSWNKASEILHKELIDVLITDLDLPDATEDEIIKQLKEIDIIKIAILTNNKQHSEKLKDVVDDFIYYGDCNEITIRKSILNVNKIRRAKTLKNRIKRNLAMVPDKI